MELFVSILKCLLLCFNYNDNYFNYQYQGMFKEGYIEMVVKIFDYEMIEVRMDIEFFVVESIVYEYVFWLGVLDGYFNFSEGWFGYCILDFEKFFVEGDYQGIVVINYCEEDVFYICIIEYKYFLFWELYENIICYCEFSCFCIENDVFYYLICMVKEKELLNCYFDKVMVFCNIIFVGCLGIYCYFDMDVIICEVIDVVNKYFEC